MPSKIRKSHGPPDSTKPKNKSPSEMDFEVLEWLEGERLEHERRMQELGRFPDSAKGSEEHHEKRHKAHTSL